MTDRNCLLIGHFFTLPIILLCIQDLKSRIEMLEEDRTEIIKEFENLQKIMASLEKENKVSVFLPFVIH